MNVGPVALFYVQHVACGSAMAKAVIFVTVWNALIRRPRATTCEIALIAESNCAPPVGTKRAAMTGMELVQAA